MFFDTKFLNDDEIYLKLERTTDSDPSKDWLPAYYFKICLMSGIEVGNCDLRIGHNERVYYGGNIGYTVFENYRGHHYAKKACMLLFLLAKLHQLDYLIITCDPDNYPSRKTCESAGGVLVEIVDIPNTHDMYLIGKRKVCIYQFDLKK